MSFESIMRALATIFIIFVIFTIGGVFLTVLLVHIEPMLLPTFSSVDMLIEYLKWRSWLAQGIQFMAYALSVVVTYIILMGGIRLASNVWTRRQEV